MNLEEVLLCKGKNNDKQYILHTRFPRMLLEVVKGDGFADLNPVLIMDELPKDAQALARIMREIGDKANPLIFG